MSDIFLEVKNIYKAYEGVQALRDVTLRVGRGEIHCIAGENGSGKSTLIKVIGGVVTPDRGEITIDGQSYSHLHAIDSISHGIQIIYQDLSLFPNLTVAENIAFNQLVEKKVKAISWEKMRSIAGQALSEIGETVDLDEPVGNLSVAKRQIVAIARALTQGARLIIMDEPTSAITRDEVEHLFSVILGLKARGISIVFVSHKLSEVFEVAEWVTVLRDGKLVGVYPAAELDDEELTFLMTGKRFDIAPYSFDRARIGEMPLLEVRNLSKKGQFRDISFKVWKGEILGIAGLIGSGRSEIALSLFGLNVPDSGEILLNGNPVVVRSPEEAEHLGIAYLPEDRLSQGLFVNQSIGDNIVITVIRKMLTRIGIIRQSTRKETESHWIDELEIKAPSARVAALGLSGGNQQRVVLAKWLATKPKLFILDGPTVGIDIGSKSNIHEIIRDLAVNGMAIIMISDEIPEILQNCNRVLVIRNGCIEQEIEDISATSEDSLFEIMAAKSTEGEELC